MTDRHNVVSTKADLFLIIYTYNVLSVVQWEQNIGRKCSVLCYKQRCEKVYNMNYLVMYCKDLNTHKIITGKLT